MTPLDRGWSVPSKLIDNAAFSEFAFRQREAT